MEKFGIEDTCCIREGNRLVLSMRIPTCDDVCGCACRSEECDGVCGYNKPYRHGTKIESVLMLSNTANHVPMDQNTFYLEDL